MKAATSSARFGIGDGPVDVGGAAVALQLDRIDLVGLGELGDDRAHGRDVHVGAVQHDQRVAGAGNFVIHLHAVDLDAGAHGLCRGRGFGRGLGELQPESSSAVATQGDTEHGRSPEDGFYASTKASNDEPGNRHAEGMNERGTTISSPNPAKSWSLRSERCAAPFANIGTARCTRSAGIIRSFGDCFRKRRIRSRSFPVAQFMRGCIKYRQSLDDQLPNAERSSIEHQE